MRWWRERNGRFGLFCLFITDSNQIGVVVSKRGQSPGSQLYTWSVAHTCRPQGCHV